MRSELAARVLPEWLPKGAVIRIKHRVTDLLYWQALPSGCFIPPTTCSLSVEFDAAAFQASELRPDGCARGLPDGPREMRNTLQPSWEKRG
jgi:hypothetical protein